MATTLEEARKILPQVRRDLHRKTNVVATGIGYKRVKGKQTGDLALICSVNVKRPKEKLSTKETIPSMIQNIPTDVNATGPIVAFQSRTDRVRPAPGGVSIGHYLITAGTLGCLVQKGGKTFILSNNHVLANSNDGSIGDPILQPGPYDGGQNPQDQIATLSEFVPIQFAGSGSTCHVGNGAAAFLNIFAAMVGSRTRLQAVLQQAGDNVVDCALAEPLNPSDVTNSILEIGTISGIADGALGMAIKKSGRTTGLTTDTIQQIDVTSSVSYGDNKVATFVDQLLAGPMSQGGDSGSAVLTTDNKIVGLLFAGGSNTTIINRIQNVFQALAVTFV
jgi:hypothetical protein